MQGKHQVIEANDNPTPDTNHEEREDVVQEPEGSKEVANEQLKGQEGLTSNLGKKVRFAENIATTHEAKQWIPCEVKIIMQGDLSKQVTILQLMKMRRQRS